MEPTSFFNSNTFRYIDLLDFGNICCWLWIHITNVVIWTNRWLESDTQIRNWEVENVIICQKANVIWCQHNHLPIIVVTANPMKGTHSKCFSSWIDDYITKVLILPLQIIQKSIFLLKQIWPCHVSHNHWLWSMKKSKCHKLIYLFWVHDPVDWRGNWYVLICFDIL